MEVVMFSSKVEDFIFDLERSARANSFRYLKLLEDHGNDLGFPRSRKLTNDVYELRVKGDIAVRLLYTFQNGKAVVLHGFIKKTNKTPKHELEVAISRLRYLQSI